MKSRILLFLIFFLVAFDAVSQGCSQCKLLAEQSAGLDESSFSSNMNYGILYLMVFPYLILLFIFRKPVWRFLKSFRRQVS